MARQCLLLGKLLWMVIVCIGLPIGYLMALCLAAQNSGNPLISPDPRGSGSELLIALCSPWIGVAFGILMWFLLEHPSKYFVATVHSSPVAKSGENNLPQDDMERSVVEIRQLPPKFPSIILPLKTNREKDWFVYLDDEPIGQLLLLGPPQKFFIPSGEHDLYIKGENNQSLPMGSARLKIQMVPGERLVVKLRFNRFFFAIPLGLMLLFITSPIVSKYGVPLFFPLLPDSLWAQPTWLSDLATIAINCPQIFLASLMLMTFYLLGGKSGAYIILEPHPKEQ